MARGKTAGSNRGATDVDILRRMFGADALIDTITGRGGLSDRTQRLQGTYGRRTDDSLMRLYNSNGFVQRIVNAPAHDATRAGFTIKSENTDAAWELERRLKELDYKRKSRDLIKFARIYPKGALFYYGVDGARVQTSQQLWRELPPVINKLQYINVVERPSNFNLRIQNSTDATAPDYNQVSVTMAGRKVHESRYSWLCNEFNPEKLEGTSVVNTIFDAISAQDSALWSSSSIMQRLSLFVFVSSEFAALSPAEQDAFLARFRTWIDTQKVVGLKEGEDLKSIDYQFRGLKDIMDFIFQNLGGVSQIPVTVLLGRVQGVLTAAEEDTINYYAAVSQEQENKLEPIDRKTCDLLLREKDSPAQKAAGKDFQYDIEYNPLWKLSPTAQADVDKKNAERDQILIESGVIIPGEARELDPRLHHLDPLDESEEGTDIDDLDDLPPATDLPNDADVQGLLAGDDAGETPHYYRVVVKGSDLFKRSRRKIINIDKGKGVKAVIGRIKGKNMSEVMHYLFDKSKWTAARAQAWVKGHAQAERGDADMDIDVALKLAGVDEADVANLIAGDPLETTKTLVRARVKQPGSFTPGSFRVKVLNAAEGIRAVMGRLKGETTLTIQSFLFDKTKWTEAKARAWVKEHGHKIV